MGRLNIGRGSFFRTLATAHCALALLLFASLAQAQVVAAARPQGDYLNAAGFGVSYGAVNERDADFWGWSIEYSRQLRGPWVGALGITWDRETGEMNGAADSEVDTFTATATISYALSKRFSLTTGLGKGFADTDNPSQSMQFTNGDLSTGIVVAYSVPGLLRSARGSTMFSLAYEYNIKEKETMLSFDVGFSWSF